MSKTIDYAGQQVNNWKIIEQGIDNKNREKTWICECKCGKRFTKTMPSIKNAKGCIACSRKHKLLRRDIKIASLIGKKFNKFEVIGLSRIKKTKTSVSIILNCKCSCGNIVEVYSHNLLKGYSKKCQKCANKERSTHGFTKKDTPKTKELNAYFAWTRIKNKYNLSEELKNDCNKFIKIYLTKPKKYMSLMPIDPNLPISEANYKWSTKGPESSISIGDEVHPLQYWMEKLGVSRQRVHQLSNRSIGLCGCGNMVVPGYQACERCKNYNRKTK